jgi:glycosyltransferase involved in cell wall biosynthesis
MNIVFFANPTFFADEDVPQFSSMPRYTKMLVDGMEERGHKVAVWSPKARLVRLPFKFAKKILGYADQYVLFPIEVKRLLKKCDQKTIFVFTDQAQGIWVPLVKKRYHIVHCHDFLAQFSALKLIPENVTRLSGRWYQKFIREGISKSRFFISVSLKTQNDLKSIVPVEPKLSAVVYNGLNKSYSPQDIDSARALLGNKIGVNLSAGYILHVGGNMWYKNRIGVVDIYHSWRLKSLSNLPLIMIGDVLPPDILRSGSYRSVNSDIVNLVGLEDDFVRLAYCGASVFVFPSLAEGFGWPIAEAMACGCPVITTNEAPMTEVAGKSGFFISRKPRNVANMQKWAEEGAKMIEKVLTLSCQDRKRIIDEGFLNVKRFDPSITLDAIERIYKEVVDSKD